MNPLNHVAIIMDGNGRWGLKNQNSRNAGHKAGMKTAELIIKESINQNIKYLTLYAFSTENWKRPPLEVRGLMAILQNVIDRELDELNKNGVQLRHIGKLERLDPTIRKKVLYAIDLTKDNDQLILNVAFNYGGRDEIVQAVKTLMRDNVSPDDVNEELLSSYMYTGTSPDPDLIIRTSGERRISNFLLWQSAYSEFVFFEKFWPDFEKPDLAAAIDEYRGRRRYGLVEATEAG